MKKLLFGAAIVALTATAAYADDEQRRNAGAFGGGVTGAIGGAIVGGPVGAAVGGIAGATVGAAAVPPEAETYVVEHPVESVRIEGEVTPSYRLPTTVTIHEIPDAPGYGYVYVDERPVIVSMETREVVHVLQ